MLPLNNVIVFIETVLLLSSVHCEEKWESPYFKDAGNKNVTIDANYIVKVLEETPASPLLLINYKGDEEPKLDSTSQFNRLFDPIVQKTADGWIIVSQKSSPDYEALNDDNLGVVGVSIGPGPDDSHDFVPVIVNVNDNNPQLELTSKRCEVSENSAQEMENCTYIITDLDGCADIVDATFNTPSFSLILNKTSDTGETYPDCLRPPGGLKDLKKSAQFYLNVLSPLDFEELSFYELLVELDDGGMRSSTGTINVQVTDLPDETPFWVTSVSSVRVDELTKSFFVVKALDGDRSIDAEICYKLEVTDEDAEEEEKQLFHLDDEKVGNVTIEEINRDLYNHDSYKMNVSAYECDDPSSSVDPVSVLVMVKDINNKIPKCTIDGSAELEMQVTLKEGTPQALPQTINVIDLDEGDAGTFLVSLTQEQDAPAEWSKAFRLIPEQGYRNEMFTITAVNATLLDYENQDWRDFTMTFVAVEKLDADQNCTISIHISLENINDERPEFENLDNNGNLVATVPENIGKGGLISIIKADDKDGDQDKIKYGLVQASGLEISDETGNITVAKDNVFDYELMPEVRVQVFAQDSMSGGFHQEFTTLIITVKDINDVAPEIILDYNSADVNETAEVGDPIISIKGTDKDTDRNLEFSIDWSKSSAKKDSVQVNDPSIYNDYCEIHTTPDADNNLIGTIDVTNIVSWNNVTSITLEIVLKDLNTDPSLDTKFSEKHAKFTINILDVNDHAPEFDPGVCEKIRSVTENAAEDRLITGGITATDIDGPGNNVVKYSISPDDKHIKIDENQGLLYTGSNPIDIDCDTCQSNLTYTVTATDQGPDGQNTSCDITINVEDINDEKPTGSLTDNNVKIPENVTTGLIVTYLLGEDHDKSESFSTVWFAIDTSINPNIENYFVIEDTERNKAVLKVNFSSTGFDYESSENSFDIRITVKDNRGDRNNQQVGNPLLVKVQITDVNDNSPIFQPIFDPQQCYASLPESTKENIRLTNTDDIYATDKDSGDFGWVEYRIVETKCVTNTNKKCPDDLTLFELKGNSLAPQKDTKAYLTTTKKLDGLYGDYIVEVEASDHGEPNNTSKENNFLKVCVYNENKNPEIVYPNVTKLSIEKQNSGIALKGGKEIPLFTAADNDFKKNGTVDFSVKTKNNEEAPFRFIDTSNQAENSFKFTLRQGFLYEDLENRYDLVITACDQGDVDTACSQCSKLCVQTELTILKTTTDEHEPLWEDNTAETTLNEADASQTYPLPPAEDENNENVPDDEKEPIYYYLIDGNDQNYSSIFSLAKETGLLSLQEPLDYLYRQNWTLQIQTSNFEDENSIPTNPEDLRSIMSLTVKVKDVNDKSPQYKHPEFPTYASQKNQVFYKATAYDPDTEDKNQLTYQIDKGSVIAEPNSNQVDYNPYFSIVSTDGSLTTTYDFNAGVKYFLLNVTATDLVQHTGSCVIRVYIISKEIAITFLFGNTKGQVEEFKEEVADTFTEYFGYTCIPGQIIPVDGNSSIATTFDVYFIDDQSEPVPAITITRLMNNITLMRDLQNNLTGEYRLNLQQIGGQTPVLPPDDSLLQGVFIGVIVALGVLLTVSIGLYVIKTRSLRQLVNNLTNATKADLPTDTTKILPNLNVGQNTNPIYNQSISIDYDVARSSTSSVATLVGIEENPEFEAFYQSIINKEEANAQNEYS